jgi:hypothetical protein
MNQPISKQFHAALTHLLAKEGRGAQSRLAREQNIDRGYMNAIAKGRKTGAENLRTGIAAYFGMTYENMLALGRAILDGENVLGSEGNQVTGKGAALSKVTKMESQVVESKEPQQPEAPLLPSISEIIMKVVDIMESDSNYRATVCSLIVDVHEKISAKKENLALEDRVKELESQVADFKRLDYEKDEVRKSA